MRQLERRRYLIDELAKGNPRYEGVIYPTSIPEQKRMLRALMNTRPAAPMTEEFEKIQDEYLREANAEKGITTIDDMQEIRPDIYLWKGDITTLKVGAIVNAANSGMTGCYQPCHGCIDNCIHTYAGIQLRNFCNEIMEKQGHEEPVGQAKITPGFNLPCDHIIHTVGPRVIGSLTDEYKEQLASCYRSCLKLADENNIDTIAFCCISTGVFMFPYKKAAEIAVKTVDEYKQETKSPIKVIFNVFSQQDLVAYRNLLQ